jgi:peptidoglycan L-alanyl-D-glutamate endopeptidase CwlK
MSDSCTDGVELCVGMSGAQVVELQARLTEAGFRPGPADGHFGPATEAAVLAFQRSFSLLADGLVGYRTATALKLSSGTVAPPSMPAIDVDVVARMFPLTPLPPIRRNLPLVLNALNAASLTAPAVVLAALATIRAEAEGFEPIDEHISRYNTSPGGHPFDLYDQRQDLGNEGPPDGARFRGRGFVQLTGRANYTKFGPKIGLPGLPETPDQANDPAIAAYLLAAFLSEAELPLKRALLDGRLATARSLVNGGTNGLARFTDAYLTGARALGVATRVAEAAA